MGDDFPFTNIGSQRLGTILQACLAFVIEVIIWPIILCGIVWLGICWFVEFLFEGSKFGEKIKKLMDWKPFEKKKDGI